MTANSKVWHIDHLNCSDAHKRAMQAGDELHHGWAVGPDGCRRQHRWIVREGQIIDLFNWTDHEDLGRVFVDSR